MAENKENKELQEQINSLREKEISLTQQLISLRDSLASTSEKDAKNLEKIRDLQQKILDLENQTRQVSVQIVDTNNRIISSQQSIVDSAEDHADTLDRIQAAQDEILETTEEQQDAVDQLVTDDKVREVLAGKQLKIYNQIDETYDSTLDLSKKLLQNVDSTSDSADRLRAISAITSAEQSAMNKLILENVDNRQEILEVVKASANAGSELVGIEKQIAEAQVAASKGKVKMIDLAESENALKELNTQLQDKSNILTEDAKQALKEKAELLQNSIELAKKQNEISEKTAGIYGSISSGMEGVFSGVSAAISKVPGGDAMMKLFGFDSMRDKIENNMGGALSNVMSSFKNGGLVEGMKSLPGAAMQFGKALLVGPQVVIFGIIAAVGALVSLFMDLDGAVSETQKELGGTKKEALAAHEAAQGMAREMNLVGVNAKELVKGMSTVSDIMGGIDVKNMMQAPGMKEMVKDATLLSEKFGMSKEEIENVHTLSVISGKSMGDLAGEAIQVAGGVMKTKDAVKLLGGISKDVAISFKGGTKELIAAAAKAKMLGMDLKKVKDIGMGMLDIEQSLEKEMEARAILGRDINLDKAREAALNGDIATLQDELLTQAGSLDEFKEGGPLKQKALADAMGMTVEEMTDMLTKAEEMNKLGLDRQLQEQLANATAAEKAEIYKKQAATLSGEAKDLALRKAAEEESASTAEKFGDIMTKIKETAMKLVAPIMDMVHGLMDGVMQGGGLMAAFDGIMAVLKPIMDIIIGIGKVIFAVLLGPIKMVWNILGPIFDYFKEIFSIFSSGEESAGGIASVFDTIVGVITTIQSVIGDVVKMFISGLLEPGKILFKAILTPIWETFKGIYDTISKAFEPLFAANDAGEETVGIMETIKKVVSFITPILEVIGALVADYIMTGFDRVASIIKIITKLFSGDLTGALDEFGSFVYETLLGIPELIITAITKIIDNIFGTNLTESVSGFFGFIKDGFKALAGLIEPIFGFIQKIGGLVLDYILQPFKSIWGVIEGIGKMFTGDLMGGLQQIGTAIADFFMSPVNLIMGIFDGLVGLFTGIGDKIKGVVKDLLPGWALDLLGLGGEEEKAAETAKSSASGGTATAEVPKMASGGTVEKGGLAIVGEAGPEVVSLPQGATVASTGASDQTSSILKALGFSDGETATASGGKSEGQGGGGGILSGITEGIGGLIGGVVGGATAAITGGGGGSADMSKVEQKLDTLISLFSQAASQPTLIKFGDKTVEEIKTQLNFKKAYNIATDNTYGRAVD